MKLLIVSDSHGLTKELIEIKLKHTLEADIMIHCGDTELEANDPGLQGYSVVRGNCDFEEKFPEDLILNAGGLRVLVTHGHRYSVKSTLMNLAYRAQELRADIVCFGHSHHLGAELAENILFINPGSIRLPKGRTEKTYVILDIGQDQATLHVYEYNRGEILELKRDFPLPISQ